MSTAVKIHLQALALTVAALIVVGLLLLLSLAPNWVLETFFGVVTVGVIYVAAWFAASEYHTDNN